MGKLAEVRSRLQRLLELSSRIRGQITKLAGPEGKEIKEKAKESGKRIGIGAAIALFGASVVAVAAVYIIAVIILLVNIALDRLWLSALIVVPGSFLFGGAIVVIGIGIIKKGAQGMPGVNKEFVEEIKDTGEEIKETIEELQEIARQEAEKRQEQMQEIMQQVKIVAPYVIGAYVGYRLVKGLVRARRARLMRMVRELEEAE